MALASSFSAFAGNVKTHLTADLMPLVDKVVPKCGVSGGVDPFREGCMFCYLFLEHFLDGVDHCVPEELLLAAGSSGMMNPGCE